MKNLHRGYIIDLNSRLKAWEICLLYYLGSRAAEAADGLILTSIDEIASESGRSIRTIRRSLDALIAKDLVRVNFTYGPAMVIAVGPTLLP